MLLYDNTAAGVLHAASDEAGRRGAAKYETAHVLLGLLRTADPVTRRVTADHPQLTVEAVRTLVDSPPESAAALSESGVGAPGRRSTPEPAAEFRQAARHFTAKWRPLVRDRRLQLGLKLGTGELWLIVLEPGTASAGLIASLGIAPEALRPLVLATMVPDGALVPDWPADIPTGALRRLLDRVFGPRS